MLRSSTDLIAYESDDFGDYLAIDWTPPQSAFLQSDATYPLFVGGMGSGKSTTMVGSMIQDLLEFPGCNIAGYCPTYDLLHLITIPKILEFLEGIGLDYDYNKTRYTIEVDQYGFIILRSLDNPARIVGYETFRAHCDELDTLPLKKARDAWNKIVARNRQVVYDEDGNAALNRVSAYTTPEGFNFCHDRWVKRGGGKYQRYHAATFSNPHLNDDYVDNLYDTYDDHLVDAYVQGLFVPLFSGRVYPSFDRVKNASEITEPKKGEMVHIGVDFNVMKGAAICHVIRGEDAHAFNEFTKSFDTDQTVKWILDTFPNNPITVYPDAAGKNRTASNTTESDIAKLKLAGFKVEAANANPPIKERVASYNARICNGSGERHYFVNEDQCPDLVATLEQQIYADNGQPDKENDLDHPGDAGGYFMYKRWPIRKRTATATVSSVL